jgi:hypothetical protein
MTYEPVVEELNSPEKRRMAQKQLAASTIPIKEQSMSEFMD